jgi:vacuolar-type H+-ATPase catalytic subunit A/Vma1
MTEIETTWYTEETSRIIANDEYLYDLAIKLARKSYSTERLAQLMKDELSELVIEFSYSEVYLDKVDWKEIASEYMEDE